MQQLLSIIDVFVGVKSGSERECWQALGQFDFGSTCILFTQEMYCDVDTIGPPTQLEIITHFKHALCNRQCTGLIPDLIIVMPARQRGDGDDEDDEQP